MRAVLVARLLVVALLLAVAVVAPVARAAVRPGDDAGGARALAPDPGEQLPFGAARFAAEIPATAAHAWIVASTTPFTTRGWTALPDDPAFHATDAGSDFTICQGHNVVHVANTGSPPGLFKARVPVVVVGHFTSDTSSDFVSNSILIKHSSTYRAQYPNRVKVTSSGPVC